MDKNSKILIVGHNDVIERALIEGLRQRGFVRVSSAFDLGLNPAVQPSVYAFFQESRPEYVFLTSTRSGGIEANQKLAGEFIYHNLEAQNNIIYAAQKFGVKKLLYVSASCVYPKECAQPMKEEYFLTGAFELTSQAYSVAKVAGMQLCQAYRQQYGFNAVCIVPGTVYGPHSDTDLEKAHVLGALMAKFHEAASRKAAEVTVWGSGNPRREFIYADDFADACFFVMERYNEAAFLNVGTGADISIKELAQTIAKVTGFTGTINFDASKPDGAPRKLLDNSRLAKLGWQPKVSFEEGLQRTYDWYKQALKNV